MHSIIPPWWSYTSRYRNQSNCTLLSTFYRTFDRTIYEKNIAGFKALCGHCRYNLNCVTRRFPYVCSHCRCTVVTRDTLLTYTQFGQLQPLEERVPVFCPLFKYSAIMCAYCETNGYTERIYALTPVQQYGRILGYRRERLYRSPRCKITTYAAEKNHKNKNKAYSIAIADTTPTKIKCGKRRGYPKGQKLTYLENLRDFKGVHHATARNHSKRFSASNNQRISKKHSAYSRQSRAHCRHFKQDIRNML